MQVAIVTHIVSPYQAELFNTIAATNQLELNVVYLHRMSRERLWTAKPPQHHAFYLEGEPNSFAEVKTVVGQADLVVFNYYIERAARHLLKVRVASKKPWCFWGERPGYRNPGWVGRLFRQWALSDLHDSKAPIWGIGQFAVHGYQQEFGTQRTYCNLPYFSDLERFQQGNGCVKTNSERVFLFSGSLIHRKGVDLLARAFTRLLQDYPNVRLKLMGEGELHKTLRQEFGSARNNIEILGFKDWSELPTYYHSADVLCVPSRYDGWGLVVPEGLAAGLPVIATDQMGAAIEFIRTGENGWLIPAGDEQALYQALCQAAALPKAQLSELSQNASASIREHSLQNGAKRFIDAALAAQREWVG